MKPIVKISLPKTISEKLHFEIRSIFQEHHSGVEAHFELTDNVSAPTVLSLSRNGTDLGRIDNDPEISSIALFRGMQITLNKAWRLQ
jgi:hypothetical protein